jgi:hypothetical protein
MKFDSDYVYKYWIEDSIKDASFTKIYQYNEPYQAKLDKLNTLSTTKYEPGEKVKTFSSARYSEKSKDFLEYEPIYDLHDINKLLEKITILN